MLGDRYNDGLMVSRGVDGRKLVEARLETIGDISGQLATLSSRIEALEECKLLGISGRCLVDGA